MFWRNFCQKSVRVKFRFFHSGAHATVFSQFFRQIKERFTKELYYNLIWRKKFVCQYSEFLRFSTPCCIFGCFEMNSQLFFNASTIYCIPNPAETKTWWNNWLYLLCGTTKDDMLFIKIKDRAVCGGRFHEIFSSRKKFLVFSAFSTFSRIINR